MTREDRNTIIVGFAAITLLPAAIYFGYMALGGTGGQDNKPAPSEITVSDSATSRPKASVARLTP